MKTKVTPFPGSLAKPSVLMLSNVITNFVDLTENTVKYSILDREGGGQPNALSNNKPRVC